jgi:hypothetical protein
MDELYKFVYFFFIIKWKVVIEIRVIQMEIL